MPPFELPELSYALDALEPHYPSEILSLHHGKHHAAYVAGANGVMKRLQTARTSGDYSAINHLQKDLAFHLSGHVMHSVFWKNMSPTGGGVPTGPLAEAIDHSLGSFDTFRAQMAAAALGIQGSGWAALSYEPGSGHLVVEQVYDHQGNVAQSATLLLVLDMWEHAYYLKWKNAKADWVDSFWHVVNWEDVANRLTGARERTG